MTKKIIITGYTSNIVKKFISILKDNHHKIDIIKCGRKKDADYNIDFNSIKETKKFNQFIVDNQPSYLLINHGVLFGKKILSLSENEIQRTLNINLISQLMILENLLNVKKIRSIFISSISGKKGSYDHLYAATKSGIDLIIKQISKSIDSQSRLNAISPGIISDARMTLKRNDFKNLNRIKKLTPTNQFTNCEDVAGLIYYLFFSNKNINGENININGGLI